MKQLSLTLLLCLLSTAYSQSYSPYEIMERSNNITKSSTSAYKAEMVLTSKNGTTKIREIEARTKEYKDSTKNIILFTKPMDIKGTGYMSWSYKDNKSNDTWIYLPQMKKLRRISSNNKDETFMGTDFTYEDMGSKKLNDMDYTLLQEEVLNNTECYKIQGLSKNPQDKTPRRLYWIGKDDFIIYQCEYYDKTDNLKKILITEDVRKNNNYYTIYKMTMKNLLTNHSTTIELKDVEYDININDMVFTESTLEEGMF